MKTFTRKEQLQHFEEIILHNGRFILQALKYCHENGIGSFRMSSRLWPLKTHPQLKYELKDLKKFDEIVKIYAEVKQFAKEKLIRLTFHPD